MLLGLQFLRTKQSQSEEKMDLCDQRCKFFHISLIGVSGHRDYRYAGVCSFFSRKDWCTLAFDMLPQSSEPSETPL